MCFASLLTSARAGAGPELFFLECGASCPSCAITAFVVYSFVCKVNCCALPMGAGLHFPPKSMENWLFAPSGLSRFAESSRIKLSLPDTSGMKAVVKTKLSFALLKSACSNIYFDGMGFLTVFILILCAVKKRVVGERRQKGFYYLNFSTAPLAPFRVPRSSCVWFSFVSSRYQHPLRKIFPRELLFLDNLGIFFVFEL